MHYLVIKSDSNYDLKTSKSTYVTKVLLDDVLQHEFER